MKICLINNLYKPYVRGGAEVVLELIRDGLVNLGHEVFVISTKPRFDKKTDDGDDIHRLRSCYYNLGKMPVFFRLFWHFYDMFDIFSAWKVERILIDEKPDLVITNNLKGISFLLPFLIKKNNISHIHILHDVQLLHPSGLIMHNQEGILDSFSAKFYMSISRRLFDFSGEIISPSKWLLDKHLQKGFFRKLETAVIHNPVDAYIANNISGEKKNDIFKFLYVGQVEKHKGVQLLIDVFADLDNVELKIVGDGSLLEELKTIIKDKDNIKFVGRKSKKEVAEIMADADCLVVPSLCYENSPTVIYEAMAAGLPVLASRIGGITEFLHGIGGILFSPGDKDDLQKKINWIIKNPQKIKDLKDGYIKKINNYSIDKYLLKILKDFSDRN